MNRVYPIKSVEKIRNLEKLMISKKKYRDLLLFVMGINTPLHISEILPLKWEFFMESSEEIKSEGTILELNQKRFVLNHSIHSALILHFTHYPYLSKKNYVFASQKSKKGEFYPITRQYVWTLLNKYGKEVGITQKIGAHTLRKTYGYHLYKKGVPLSKIQRILNQPSIAETLLYLDISIEEYNSSLNEIVTPDL